MGWALGHAGWPGACWSSVMTMEVCHVDQLSAGHSAVISFRTCGSYREAAKCLIEAGCKVLVMPGQ